MLPHSIKSYNVFIEGYGYAGLATKVKLPKLEKEMKDYIAAGMLGPVKIDLGQKGMEIGFSFGEYNSQILKSWGIQDASGIGARFMGGAVSESGAGTDAIEISVRGRWESLDFGEVENQKPTELQVSMPITYYKYSQNGEVLIEIDMISGRMVVNGKDLTADLMKAIGQTA